MSHKNLVGVVETCFGALVWPQIEEIENYFVLRRKKAGRRSRFEVCIWFQIIRSHTVEINLKSRRAYRELSFLECPKKGRR